VLSPREKEKFYSEWRPHEGGKCPFKKDRPVYVRIRCRSRADVERGEPRPAGSWERWSHDGGPGDIVEVKLP